jgi:hypothetical protein
MNWKEMNMRTIRILLAFLALAIPAVLFGQVNLSISIGPPALPVYEQPICPGDGYLWTPGYWAYDDSVSDYYWVDGTWVMAPEEGFLWTPGYWGWRDGGFLFNDGYWGPEVGFYGGINYGFGYYGEGFGGGRWDHGHFFYNRSESHVDGTNIHNVYNEKVDHGSNANRVSYNGGNGGVDARANSQQEAAARQRHIAPVTAQTEHAQTARANPALRASANQGGTSAAAPRAVVHPNDLAPIARPAPSNSGDAKADKKYNQQQDKLIAQQTKERQNLQQKQDAEHQVNASPAKTQKLEQKHSQQTQRLSQRHQAQQQSMQSRQPQARSRR